MNKVEKIMDVLNSINYGFIDKNGFNIFDDDLNVENTFNKVYRLMSPVELLEKNMAFVGIK